jgi:hypothetical protein
MFQFKFRARRRRSGGGPKGRRARMPVGTYLYLYAVGATNHVAVPCMARSGAKRDTGSCDPRDLRLPGRYVRKVLEITISVHWY